MAWISKLKITTMIGVGVCVRSLRIVVSSVGEKLGTTNFQAAAKRGFQLVFIIQSQKCLILLIKMHLRVAAAWMMILLVAQGFIQDVDIGVDQRLNNAELSLFQGENAIKSSNSFCS
jgi:hypothetical protein